MICEAQPFVLIWDGTTFSVQLELRISIPVRRLQELGSSALTRFMYQHGCAHFHLRRLFRYVNLRFLVPWPKIE